MEQSQLLSDDKIGVAYDHYDQGKGEVIALIYHTVEPAGTGQSNLCKSAYQRIAALAALGQLCDPCIGS